MDVIFQPIAFFDEAQDFFSRMFADILAGRVTLESVVLVLAFFGSFIALTALSYLFAQKPKNTMLDVPISWVTEYKRITELFEAAITQRCKVRVSFQRDDNTSRSTDGVLTEILRESLKLELSSVGAISSDWAGRTLELYFRLRLPENPKVYSTFSFISDIFSSVQQPNGVMELRISRPLRLELTQNRRHLRVEPPDKYIRAIRLWSEDTLRRSGDTLDPDTWGDPLYGYDSGGLQEVRIDNISGGGIRLDILPEALRTKPHKLAAGQIYYGQFILSSPDMDRLETHYVMMRLVKCYDDCDSKIQLSLGLTFIYHGVPQDPPANGLTWIKLSQDYGIREIDDWAYALHLELYRNKGIA